MSLSRVLTDVTDAMDVADRAVTEAFESGALVDAPAEVSMALLRFAVAARNACEAIVSHYAAPSEMEDQHGIAAVTLW